MANESAAPGVNTVATPDFNAEQLVAMGDQLVNQGALTREEANAALKVDGVEPPAVLSPEEIEYDRLFPRAKNPNEYEMPRIEGADPKTTIAVDKLARGWLHTAGFDRERGSTLLKEINRAAEQFAKLSEPQRELFQKAERLKLERLYGDKTAEKIRDAGQLIKELEAKAPGIVDIMNAGPGDSAMVISLVAAQASILGNRPKRKK